MNKIVASYNVRDCWVEKDDTHLSLVFASTLNPGHKDRSFIKFKTLRKIKSYVKDMGFRLHEGACPLLDRE